MAILEHNEAASAEMAADLELVTCLNDLRREIGALRQELIEANQPALLIDDESYRLATKIDLLVSKFLRLRQNPLEDRE